MGWRSSEDRSRRMVAVVSVKEVVEEEEAFDEEGWIAFVEIGVEEG